MSFHPFSARKTREALQSGQMSQGDERRYWLYSGGIWLFYLYHMAWIGMERNWFVLYDVAIAVTILWIGMSETFKANGGDEGQEFVRRMALLGVPLGIVVLLASQALYWASWHLFPLVMQGGVFRKPEMAWQVLHFFLFNAIQVWFWWRTCHHLRLLKGNPDV